MPSPSRDFLNWELWGHVGDREHFSQEKLQENGQELREPQMV